MLQNKIFYDLNWNGSVSNVLMIFVILFFGFFIGLFAYKIAREFKTLRTVSCKATWGGAFKFLLLWIPMILLAGIAGGSVSGRDGGTTSCAEASMATGMLDGFNSRIEPGRARWLAISLFGLPLLIALLVSTVAYEQPIRLGVSPTEIDVIYRLPWRNRSIRMSDVMDVCLKRHDYNRVGPSHFYTMKIRYGGKSIKIWCSQRPWYEEQIKDAYIAIKEDLVKMGKS